MNILKHGSQTDDEEFIPKINLENLEWSKCWWFKCLQQPYDGVMSYRVGFHLFLTPAVMSATNCSVVVSFPSVLFDLRVPH